MKPVSAAFVLMALTGCTLPSTPPVPLEQPEATTTPLPDETITTVPATQPRPSVGVAVGTNGSAVAVGTGNVSVGIGTGGRIGRGGHGGIGFWF